MSVDLDPKYVHRGFWVDLDRGPVLGQTITTDTGTGTLIVSLLAVLVTLGTAHLWHLVSFIIHQVRADGQLRDGLFRQQQAMLRTLPTPSSAMADAIKLWWSWRKRADSTFVRMLLIFILALLTTAGTITASIFSSFIVDSSNLVVLVNSPFCGAPSPDSLISRDEYPTKVLELATKYGPLCYKEYNETIPRQCTGAFLQRTVPYNISMESCPFEKEMCVPGSDGEAVALDSNLLDVNEHFGMNLPVGSHIKFRRKTTCSVLSLDGRTQIHNVSDLFLAFGRAELIPGEKALSIHYGSTGSGRILNATQMTSLAATNLTFDFDITGQAYYSAPDSMQMSSFDPIPELKREDGDTILKIIGLNGMKYLQPIDDPLYSAHKEFTAIVTRVGSNEIENITTYSHDDPLKAIGCLQQYQFCHNRQNQDDFCTPLMPLPSTVEDSMFPGSNDLQKAAIQLFVNTSFVFDSANAPDDLMVRGMALPPSMHVVPELPQGMWWMELAVWERSVWASIQIAIVDWAIGPKVRDPAAADWVRPSTTAEKQLCSMQRMRASGNIVNINVFALSFIIAFSTFIMLLDTMLLKFLIYLSRFRRALAPRIDRWIQDGVWQLQRRAYEGEGYREWTGLEGEIPVTEKGQLLKDLPILWVPGKSPNIRHAETFETMRTVNSKHPLQQHVEMSDEEELVEPRPEPKRGRWVALMFWKR